jgi:mono/diheme cytochrome c family protein
MRRVPSACALVLIGAMQAPAQPSSSQPPELPPPAARPVDFTRDIKPILETSCTRCHGRGKAKGGFSLETRTALLEGGDMGPAVVEGKSADSYLIALVAGLDPDEVMPKKGSRLKPDQVGLLRAWIDQGLPWDPAVSFARIEPRNLERRQPALPPPTRGAAHPIDRLLAPYFARQAVKPGRLIDDRQFARRAYFDILGLPPAPAELEAFLREPGADKRDRLVARLLADRQRYAEHWLSFWNDMLRNDYKGTGYIDGGRTQITTWLYAALANDLPYDRFVAQLIDPVPGAEGFTKGIVWRGVVNASQTPPMQAAQNISQVFMGVNLKCASCHDSFINDWQLSEAYGLAAVYADGPLEMVECDRPTGKTAPVRFLYPALGTIDGGAPRADRLKQLAAAITGPKNGRLSRTIVNRLWARFMGRGLVEPLDDMEREAWQPGLLDWLAEDLVAHGYDLKHTIAVILASRAYQLASVDVAEPVERYVFQGPSIRRLSAEQFVDALSAVTGLWAEKPAGQIDFAAAGTTAPLGRTRAALTTGTPLTVALGRPNREQVVTVRGSTATTLQALELLNGETLAASLRGGAERLLAEDARTAGPLVDRVYRRALGREPTRAERALSQDLVGRPATREGVEDLLWAVIMLPEFQLIY